MANGFLVKRSTWLEVGVESLHRDRFAYRVMLTTGIDSVSLGVVLRRPTRGSPFGLALAVPFLLLSLEVWP